MAHNLGKSVTYTTFTHEFSLEHIWWDEVIIGLRVFPHVLESGFVHYLINGCLTEIFLQEVADLDYSRLQILRENEKISNGEGTLTFEHKVWILQEINNMNKIYIRDTEFIVVSLLWGLHLVDKFNPTLSFAKIDLTKTMSSYFRNRML